ncbi:hypothetical protein L1987_64089 [Smallanthus sonchifolius]|uniref:Uncharacterized protein n=1 Tax=Smallanthus sonchifolius TaxID=185202 RepID=A0ACB9CF01_9ASTR|nr:hypothetical protein L1987_64089 [Smallanthus sonchifolius]
MQQTDSKSVPPVCETLMDRHGDTTEDPDIPDSTIVEVPSDFPPESFWLSKDAEFDWFDRNAFLERKESTRGNLNSVNSNPAVNPSHSNSSSQRYSVKTKAPIIGLPKSQKTTFVELKCRQCKPANVRLFPKQLYSVGKAPETVPVTEPSSPKVSCIGRVRSKRCPSRRKASVQAVESVKSASQGSGTARAQKAGLMSRIVSFFRSEGRRRKKNSKSTSENMKKPAERSGSRRIYVAVKPVNSEPGTPSEPAGLGGMVRFASRRRSDYWQRSENDDVAGRH